MPKLIMADGVQLELFITCFINNIHIEKDTINPPKEESPPPLVLTHPVVNLVHIPMLITEVNQVHVMILQVVHIQKQKLSITYHI